MIDNTALLAAATFLEYNGFTCNCEQSESTNYTDLVAKWAPYFLLSESNNGGKKGLRPLLPVTAAGQIKTTAITPEYVFTDDTVIAGTVEIDYLSLADRLPFVAQVVWRQQLESNIGIIRTAEVRYAGTAESGPYETHDLSAFCTSEDHAVKIGAYILAKRVYPTHVIRFSVRPQSHNISVTVGDIVAVSLTREATNYVASMHSYLYQVERITKTLAGDVTYEATHFPVDSQSRSLIALDVAAAVGTGIILPSGRTGVSCDVNSSADNTIPSETFTESAEDDDKTELTPSGSASSSGGGSGFNSDSYTPTTDAANDDALDFSSALIPVDNPTGANGATPGAVVTLPNTCNGTTPIYSWSGETSATYTSALVLTRTDIGKDVYGTVDCGGGAPPKFFGPIRANSSLPDLNQKFIGTYTVSVPNAPGGPGSTSQLISYGEPPWFGDAGDSVYVYGRDSLGQIQTIGGYLKFLDGNPAWPSVVSGGNTSDGSRVSEIRDAATNALIYTYPP
jgi:hypothetical protein